MSGSSVRQAAATSIRCASVAAAPRDRCASATTTRAPWNRRSEPPTVCATRCTTGRSPVPQRLAELGDTGTVAGRGSPSITRRQQISGSPSTARRARRPSPDACLDIGPRDRRRRLPPVGSVTDDLRGDRFEELAGTIRLGQVAVEADRPPEGRPLPHRRSRAVRATIGVLARRSCSLSRCRMARVASKPSISRHLQVHQHDVEPLGTAQASRASAPSCRPRAPRVLRPSRACPTPTRWLGTLSSTSRTRSGRSATTGARVARQSLARAFLRRARPKRAVKWNVLPVARLAHGDRCGRPAHPPAARLSPGPARFPRSAASSRRRPARTPRRSPAACPAEIPMPVSATSNRERDRRRRSAPAAAHPQRRSSPRAR